MDNMTKLPRQHELIKSGDLILTRTGEPSLKAVSPSGLRHPNKREIIGFAKPESFSC
jgi:hypothetical protein